MAKHATITAEPRSVQGKKVARLRREGQVPGVIYGPAIKEPRMVTVDARTFGELYQASGATALIDLTVDGGKHTVFIRDVQMDAIKRAPIHVEFYAPNLTQVTTVRVPIVTVGEVASLESGIVEHGKQDIEVRALPEDLPQQIEVNLALLTEIDATLYVSDLQVPSNIELLAGPDEMVIKLAAPRVQVEEEPTPEEALDEELGDAPAALNEDAEPVVEGEASSEENEA